MVPQMKKVYAVALNNSRLRKIKNVRRHTEIEYDPQKNMWHHIEQRPTPQTKKCTLPHQRVSADLFASLSLLFILLELPYLVAKRRGGLEFEHIGGFLHLLAHDAYLVVYGRGRREKLLVLFLLDLC